MGSVHRQGSITVMIPRFLFFLFSLVVLLLMLPCNEGKRCTGRPNYGTSCRPVCGYRTGTWKKYCGPKQRPNGRRKRSLTVFMEGENSELQEGRKERLKELWK